MILVKDAIDVSLNLCKRRTVKSGTHKTEDREVTRRKHCYM